MNIKKILFYIAYNKKTKLSSINIIKKNIQVFYTYKKYRTLNNINKY